ncbi:MAG: cell wall hydrolase [Methylocystis sp.]
MRGRSNTGWAVGVIAPWCLGVGVLVSFTASAGQDVSSGWNEAPLTARVGFTPEQPSLASALSGSFVHDENRPIVELARLNEGGPFDLHSPSDESEPHVDLKPNAANFPQVDRSHKGDPLVAMRPSFDTRLHGGGAASDLAFRAFDASTQVMLAPRSALPGDDNARDFRSPAAATETTTQKGAAALPAQSGSASTPVSAEAARERAEHGATPPVPRAVALGSSTPAQPDAVPIEVASFPRATLALQGSSAPNNARPDYAAMIDQDKMSSEKRCLAEAVYFEARSEPEAGQAAVAQVVLNRVSSGLYPNNVCGVVYQNRHHYKGCQFSFACEGKSLRITERDAWDNAVRVADEVMAGRTYISDVGRSTHYHANYVKPRWARSLTKMDVIGHHVFYRLKGGQT